MSTAARPDSGGISFGPLLIAGVLASPALWRALEQHQLPLSVALERLLVIAVLCVVVGDVVKRYLDVVPVPETTPAAAAPGAPGAPGSAATAPGAGPATAPADAASAAASAAAPTPFEQTSDWGAGDLDDDDLFALDPLPGEDPHPAIG